MLKSFLEFILPNLPFLLFVLVAFSILQSVIVLFLVWLEEQNHERLMILMLRCYRHYRKLKWIFPIAGILLLVGALWILWSYRASASARPEFTVFAGVLLLVIVCLFLVLRFLGGQLSLKKGRDGLLYFGLSLILYFFVLALVNQRFPDYRHFVVTNVVDPAVLNIRDELATAKRERLLDNFRRMARNGECLPVDYRKREVTDNIRNFVYIATDPEFKIKAGEATPGELADIVKGRSCTDGETVYQLTDYGKWYWMVETEKQAVMPPAN